MVQKCRTLLSRSYEVFHVSLIQQGINVVFGDPWKSRLFSSYLLRSESRLRFSFISVLLSPYFMRIQGQEKTIRKDFLQVFLLSEMQLPPPVLTSTCQPWRADSPAAAAWRERASTLPFEGAIMKIKGRAGRLEVSFLQVWNIMKHHEIWWILQPLSLKVLNSKVSFCRWKAAKMCFRRSKPRIATHSWWPAGKQPRYE